MLFLIPAGIVALKATAAVTAAKVVTTAVIVGTGALVAKALHEAGRREGLGTGASFGNF